jgi:hypothetical protein
MRVHWANIGDERAARIHWVPNVLDFEVMVPHAQGRNLHSQFRSKMLPNLLQALTR